MTEALLNNRYRITYELAEGGFGKTFLAQDTQTPSLKKCVIKQLKPVTGNSQIYQLVQERFQREAAILEDLGDHHSQIPRLYAYFAEEGQFYLIQEFIEGQTLRHKLEQVGMLGENLVKEILLNILPVLEYIQSKGIIHRDIKPDNIILRAADNKPVLIDFGAVRETMGTVVTNTGNSTNSIVIGTPGFMPSEQSIGRPVFASDLYSLGLTAVYLLTGKIPQDLPTDVNTGEIIWRQYTPNISEDLAKVLDKAIKPHHRDRYINAKAMLADLQASTNTNPVPATFIYSDNQPIPNTSVQQQNSSQASQPLPAIPLTQPHPSGEQLPIYSQSTPQGYVTGNPQPVYASGGGTFNTNVPVPPEISGWNWGAFLLPGLWPLTNQVWIGLLCWIPFVNFVMVFLLGAKGNTWAWRSRQWQSVEQFKAHQRAWAKAGLIVWGSLIGLFILLNAIGIRNEPDPEVANDPGIEGSNQPTTPTTPPPTPTQPSTPSTQKPTQQAATNPIDIPPKVNINGNIEQTREPNQYIDGDWQLQFSVGTVVHDSYLRMNGRYGEMITQYYDASTGKTEQVYQQMRLWSASQGLIIKGHNPIDVNTKQPHPTYSPDEIFMQQKSDGSLYVDNCSGGVCSHVTIKYLGKPQ